MKSFNELVASLSENKYPDDDEKKKMEAVDKAAKDADDDKEGVDESVISEGLKSDPPLVTDQLKNAQKSVSSAMSDLNAGTGKYASASTKKVAKAAKKALKEVDDMLKGVIKKIGK